jgi:ABC-2 type transport system permease protein
MNDRRAASLRATALVTGRELRESFRRKSLWIVLAILFVGSSAAMIVPELLDEGSTRYDVAVVDGSTNADAFESSMRSVVSVLDERVRFVRVPDLPRARALVDDGKADAGVAVGDDPVVVVRAGDDSTLVPAVRQALATTQVTAALQDAGLDRASIDRVLRAPAPRVVEVDIDNSDRQTAAAVLSLVLYLVLLMLMVQVANGVAIEKANRISEVLLAVVRPGALLFGKVLGVALVGLAGLVVAAIPVLVKGIAGGDLPVGLGSAIGAGSAWILLGLVLYLTIAGSLGALVERQEEAGSVLTPLSLLLVATYVLAQSTAETTFGVVLAIFPLTSPIVMPTRIALGAASAPEIVASLVVLAASLVLVLRVGSAIYRRGIVHTGRRLRLGEALRSP